MSALFLLQEVPTNQRDLFLGEFKVNWYQVIIIIIILKHFINFNSLKILFINDGFCNFIVFNSHLSLKIILFVGKIIVKFHFTSERLLILFWNNFKLSQKHFQLLLLDFIIIKFPTQ